MTTTRRAGAQPARRFGAETMMDVTMTLPIEMIERDPGQPRKTFKPGPLQELAENIAAVGLLQPIVVRPVWLCAASHTTALAVKDQAAWTERAPRPCKTCRAPAAAKAMIVVGERRWRACTLAKRPTMAVIVKVNTPRLREMQLAENLLRQDMEPIELAQALKDLLDQGADAADLGRRLGRQGGNPAQWVTNHVALLELIPMCKEALRIGALSVDKAMHVARLSREMQHAAFVAYRDGKIGEGHELQLYCDAVEAQEAQGALFTLPKESREAAAAIEKVDRVLARLIRFVRETMDEETLQVLARVTEWNVAGRMHQVDVLMKHIRRIRQALELARITGAMVEPKPLADRRK